MPAIIAECPTVTQSPVAGNLSNLIHLHDNWSRMIGATDENYWGTEFLKMIVKRYPKLLGMATGKEKSKNGRFNTNSVNYMELESLAFRWRIYRFCKEEPGCIAPLRFRKMFEEEQ